MEVRVEQVAIPAGSTIGFVSGRLVNDPTKVVIAAAEGRSAAALGEALEALDEAIIVDIPDWAVLEILELP